MEGINFKDVSTQILNISIQKLTNPTSATNCSEGEMDFHFQIKLVDLNIGEIIYSTSPSVDDKNCFEFDSN